MSFEGGNSSPRQERQSLSAEWLKFHIDPAIPLTLRTWVRDMTEEQAQDPTKWPEYIKTAMAEHLGIAIDTLPSQGMRSHLTEALAEHDAQYVASREARVEAVDRKLPEEDVEKQRTSVQDVPEEVTSEPDTDASDIVALREALRDSELSSKDRRRIEPMVARYDAAIATTEPAIAVETPERASERRQAIKRASSLNELIEVLRGIGDVQNGGEVLPSEELIEPVERVRNLNVFTRNSLLEDLIVNEISMRYGLRDKVISLLEELPVKDNSVVEKSPEETPDSDTAEEQRTALVSSATSPDEFFDALRSIGIIPSSTGPIAAKDIIEAFKTTKQKAASGQVISFEHLVPRAYGVRAKFRELIAIPDTQDESSESLPEVKRVSPESVSDINQLRADLADLRTALSSESLSSKKRVKVEAAVSWYETQIDRLEKSTEGITEAVVETEALQGVEVANPLPRTEKVVAGQEALIDRSEGEPGRIGSESASKNVRGEISPEAAQLFEKAFNIKTEDLASIEGFTYLSPQQQKFVLENLSQLTLGNVREEAARTVSEAVGMRKSEMTQNYGKFLGGVLSGAREAFTGGYTKLKTEKAVVARMEKGGMAEHGALLQELVSNIAKYGPRVNERAGGELVVDLVNIRDRASDQRIREAEFFAIGELNAAAYEFTKTPAEWKGKALGTEEWKITSFFKEKVLRTSGKVQESAYEKRAAAYEQKKRQLEEVLKQKGYDDLKIAETLIGLDSRVHQLQTLRTSPDAMAELAKIKDKSFFAESAKHFFAGPGAYMALGAVGRTLGGAALGFVGAPIASASVAWLRSWNRTAAELRERDRNARAGVIDKRSGALNVVAAEDAERTVLVNGKPMQNGLTAKLERLLEQAENATGDQKKRLLEQLRLRVEYVHDKQKLQRVNYGKAEGKVSRQVALTEALAKSLAHLSAQDMMAEAKPASRFARTKEKAEGRLDQKLKRTERGIIELRRLGREADAIKSMTVAASFSFAGALAADYFKKDSFVFHESPDATLDTDQNGVSTLEKEKSISDGASDSSDSAGVLSMKEAAPYTIQRGDTLIGIMREKIPAIRGLGTESTMARENATMNILRDLTPKELQDIGITSGNVNKIYAGDSINIEKLNEAILARKGMIERAITRFGTTPIGGNPLESVASSDPTPIAEVTETTEKTVTLQRAANDLGKLPREIGYEPAVVPESWTSSEAIENRKIRLIERTRSFFASPDAWDRVRTIPITRILGAEGGYPVNDPQLKPVINFFKSIEPSGVRIALPLAPTGYTVERYLNSFADLLARDLTPQEYERFVETRIGGGAPESIPTVAAEASPTPVVDPEMPLFKGGFDGELITEETSAETFPLTDVAEGNKVEMVAEAAKTEGVPVVAETPVSSAVIAERKTALMDAIKERYASEREWKRTLNLRMQDIARYEGVATTNPESVAGRAQTVFAMKAALEAAGLDATESKAIFERVVNGKLSVGAYLEAVSQAVAAEEKPEVYEKLLKALDPEVLRATAMEQWTKPEAVATRAKELQTLFTESLRANDRTQWARWAQGWQSPFSNKSELFLESARQHLISQREQFVDLLKKYKIPLAPQGGESQSESIARFSRLLALKITPEDLQRLDLS